MNNQLPNFPPGKAAIFNGPGKPFELVTRNVPYIKPGEILVRTIYTTLCGSDIHTYCGRRQEPPHVVLGHEIVGDILFIDPAHSGSDFKGKPIHIGDRITWSIFSVPKGVGSPRPDIPQKSEQLFKYGHTLATDEDVFNGGLAEYCVLRANTAVIKISKSMPAQVAATINCAHSTVMGAIRVAGEISDKKILVFGAGLLGLSCVSMCKEFHAAWIGMADHDRNRLAWSKKFGAEDDFLVDEKIDTNHLPWRDADVVFDMTGSPQVMRIGVDSLAVGGCAVWIGAVYPAEPVPVDAQKVVRRLLQIRGLHNYNYDDFVNATTFIENNYFKYPFESLIEKEYEMDEIEEAFAFASKNKPVRVGIKFHEQPRK